MNGGIIFGNTAGVGGGGVYIYSGTFKKENGGVIYGKNEVKASDRNNALYADDTLGHAVSCFLIYYRDTTLTAEDDISTNKVPETTKDNYDETNWIKRQPQL